MAESTPYRRDASLKMLALARLGGDDARTRVAKALAFLRSFARRSNRGHGLISKWRMEVENPLPCDPGPWLRKGKELEKKVHALVSTTLEGHFFLLLLFAWGALTPSEAQTFLSNR